MYHAGTQILSSEMLVQPESEGAMNKSGVGISSITILPTFSIGLVHSFTQGHVQSLTEIGNRGQVSRDVSAPNPTGI